MAKPLPKVTKKVSLLKKVNSYLKKAANPTYSNNYTPKPRIKPSDLGSPCYRKIYYSYLRTPRDVPLSSKEKRIFDTGDAVHEMIQEWIKKLGCVIEYRDPKTGQIPINKYTGKPDPEFPIVVPELDIKSGKIDAALDMDGELWLGEFKSSNAKKFGQMTDAKADHKIQANTYVHLFEYCWENGLYDHIEELEKFDEVKGVIFIYLNKDTSDLKEYVLEKTHSDLDDIVSKISEIKSFVERKELPEPTEHFCPWCPWRKSCKKDFNPLDNG